MVNPNDSDAFAMPKSKDPFPELTFEHADPRTAEKSVECHRETQSVFDFSGIVPVPSDHTFDLLKRCGAEAGKRCASRGEELLFDELSCGACGCPEAQRNYLAREWCWVCVNCGNHIDDGAAVAQLQLLLKKSVPVDRKIPKKICASNVQIFSATDLNAAAENVDSSSSDEHAKLRLKLTLRRLLELGTDRPMAVPGSNWSEKLDELRDCFPNFLPMIDEVLEPSMSIEAAGGHARPAPVLLVGPPGVGKSYFAGSVASVLQTCMFKVDMASATTGAAIEGLSVHFGNSSPGELFKVLAFGRGGVAATANPLGFLDELDKVNADLRYDPLAPLYTLLEVESARNFEDQSLPGIRFDASYVRWIACANDLYAIPKPILSRLHIVHVKAPTGAETHRMFERIFEGVVENTSLQFDVRISKKIIADAVAKFSAREFKTKAVMAIGKALVRNRRHVESEDFCISTASATPKMGF